MDDKTCNTNQLINILKYSDPYHKSKHCRRQLLKQHVLFRKRETNLKPVCVVPLGDKKTSLYKGPQLIELYHLHTFPDRSIPEKHYRMWMLIKQFLNTKLNLSVAMWYEISLVKGTDTLSLKTTRISQLYRLLFILFQIRLHEFLSSSN